MLSKEYSAWHARKTLINNSGNRPYFYEREAWWVAIGHNIGDEEDGKGNNFARPVLIIRKFSGALFYGLPMSTSVKRGKYYYALNVRGKKNAVLLSHLRDYDTKRLINKLAVISEAEYVRIKAALINLLQQPARPSLKILNPRQRRG